MKVLSNLQRSWHMYLQLTKASILNQLEYRMDFAVRMINGLLRLLVMVLLIEVLFAQTNEIAGWNKAEMTLLIGMYRFVSLLWRAVIFDNLESLAATIADGQLDRYLLKPVNTRLFLSVEYFNFDKVINSLSGLILVIAGWLELTIAFTVEKFVGILVVIIIAGYIFYNFFLTCQLLAFWLGRIQHIHFLGEALMNFGRLPANVFASVCAVAFQLILPVVAFGALPAAILLGRLEPIQLLWLVVSAVIWTLISEFTWRRGLRSYTSGGG